MGLIHDWERLRELVRFYQAALLNTAFGIIAYTALVALGVNMYAAQAMAHLIGIAFNYFTYSRHVFRGSEPAKLRFAVSYAVHYLIGLGILAFIAQFILNPYIAGIATAFIMSLFNYFVLRKLVFQDQER